MARVQESSFNGRRLRGPEGLLPEPLHRAHDVMDVGAEGAGCLYHRCRMTLQAMANCRANVPNGKSKPGIPDIAAC